MTMRRHEHMEELISASLTGELSESERAQLDAHLDRCDQCRETLAAFADQRRIVAGVRHVAPPRDLGARVRTGIESGAFAPVPWWRRPAVLFATAGGGLAAVAGALLAMVVLNATPDNGQVGVGSASPEPTVTVAPSPVPSAPQATLTASPAPTPVLAPEPPEWPPEPDVYLAYTGPFDNLLLTMRDGGSGDTLMELEAPGPAVAAELSPNAQFLAYITRLGESGLNELWVTQLPATASLPAFLQFGVLETDLDSGETVSLGESVAGSEFLERLEWSPTGRFMSYTLATPGAGTDVWVFDATTGESIQLTDVGNAYTAGWTIAGDRMSLLWALISVAGTEPVTYVHPFVDMTAEPGDPSEDWPIDPAEGAIDTLSGVFQPYSNVGRDTHAIYWRGRMEQIGDEWLFGQGGALHIAEVSVSDDTFELVDEQPLFADLTIGRDAFTSAGVAWGKDGDTYAVWGAQWTGTSQGSRSEYPSRQRVYFSHASDPRNITEVHAIDAADLPEGASVVDVKVPTGRHLLVTAQMPIGGVMEAPRAHLILVTRNTGAVPDEVRYLPGEENEGWFGPAALDGYGEISVTD